MQEKATVSLLLREFPYEPTSGQHLLIERLGRFLTSTWENPNALFLLKGYAGTGKTTIVTALVNVLPHLKKRFVLLAPTGRAAKVLAGYTKKPANTIHRKIYFARTTKEGVIALKLQQNLHTNTLFIVDEASMIQNSSMNDFNIFNGRSLMDDLFYYVYSGEGNKLMFIGDSAQLPPVGLDNSPALDQAFLKSSYHLDIDTCELTEVVRQAQDSGILSNATHIRKVIDRQEFRLPLFSLGNFPDIRKLTGSDLEDALNSAYSGREKDSNVVICRSNKRANIYNQEIRKRILFFEEEINTGDYMMVVKNNYFWLPEDSAPGFIANGDIIELLRIRSIHEMYGFRFADVTIRFLDYPEEKEQDVKILLDTIRSESPALSQADNNRLFQEVMKDYEDLTNKRKRIEKVKVSPYFNALQVKFAYALTCHKTQGGQWETVFLDQCYLTDKMMNIEYLRWLYTGVTRATKKLFLINFEEKFFEENRR
jgi:exodeoxyribonuclease V